MFEAVTSEQKGILPWGADHHRVFRKLKSWAPAVRFATYFGGPIADDRPSFPPLEATPRGNSRICDALFEAAAALRSHLLQSAMRAGNAIR